MRTIKLFIALFFIGIGAISAQIDVLHNFTSYPSDGANPYASLTLSSGNIFYGMTSQGGKFDQGSIFSITAGGTYDTIYSFNGSYNYGNVGTPYGSLTLSASKTVLFGMSNFQYYDGTNWDDGSIIFSIHTNGSDYKMINSIFADGTLGGLSYGSLTLSGGTLYGMTYDGGRGGVGFIFSVDTAEASTVNDLWDFNWTGSPTDSGYSPYGSLTLSASGTILYGMTSEGGYTYTVDGYGIGNGGGVIFSINTNGTGYKDLHIFHPADGETPTTNLTLSGAKLYGTTSAGGEYGYGTIFSIDTNGTGYTVLHNFDATEGAGYGSLTLVGSGNYLLVGMTEYGTLFTIHTNGTGYTAQYNLNTPHPYVYPLVSSLVADGAKLFGMTTFNGTSSDGTVFSEDECTLEVTDDVVQNVTCDGAGDGIITALASGGTRPYIYSWSDGHGTDSIATELAAGTYTVTVTDYNDCSKTASATITRPAALAITITEPPVNVSCYEGDNGSATANEATGGTSPYTYSWSPDGGTNLIASDLTVGVYTVTAKDNHGCTATAKVTITQPSAALEVSIASQVNPSCPPNNGSITANAATGGTSPYNYLWSPRGGTNLTASGLGADTTFIIIATDSHGCPAAASTSLECSGEHKAQKNGEDNGSSNPQLTDVVVYPNPNSGQFTVAGLTNGMTIEIYDYTGRRISAISASNNTMQLNIAGQADGIYLIRILSKDGTVVNQNKVVKTN